MALPTGNIAWPPADVAREITRVNTLAGWYGGKRDVVSPARQQMTPALQTPRWWQPGGRSVAGGTTGWGESEPIRVPLAADIAGRSADLLFSDMPDVTVDPAAQDRWEEIEDGIGWEALLVEAAELCAALSGIYWRTTFDLELEPRWPIVSFIQPDNAWPEWSWGRLRAVTFWRVLPSPPGSSDKVRWRHLERHSMTTQGGLPVAIVEHGLYQGEEEKLGVRVPLTDHPDTAGIADSLTDADMIVMPKVTRTFGYVPNMRPNRVDRGSPLGRPDIEQQEDLLRSVNDTWTSWMRDLRLGKGRIIVPDEYLRVGAAGEGAAFDVDREAYSGLRMMAPSGSDQGLHVVQFAIRVAEHEATIRALVQQIVTGAGYNLFTFGMADPGAAAATATEVDARNDLSLATKGKKANYWQPELRALVASILTLDAARQYPGSVTSDPAGVDAHIDREIAPKPGDVAQTANLLKQAGAASTQTLVQMVHPEWPMEDVLAEVQRIQQEQGVPVQDPTALGGAAGGSPVDALLAQMDGQMTLTGAGGQ